MVAVGIDEVGRGCWAGPLLVVAAQATRPLPVKLADSKVLSKAVRQKLFYEIQLCCKVGEGWVEAPEIDTIGLSKAMKLGVKRALEALGAAKHEVIILDGSVNYCPPEFTNAKCLVNADATEPTVMAASIWAKVRRDQFMMEAAQEYPHYSFEKHVGYGTKQHQEALKLYGICALHRVSYKPIKALVELAA